MQADPRFPDRPTHPDFDLLSEAVCANDELSELSRDAFLARTASYVDVQSIEYVALQRAQMALVAKGLPIEPSLVAMLAGMIVDGFMTGVVFGQLKSERDA